MHEEVECKVCRMLDSRIKVSFLMSHEHQLLSATMQMPEHKQIYPEEVCGRSCGSN